MAQILRLQRSKVNVLIHGVGEKPQHARNAVRTQIRSRKEDFALDVDFLVLKSVIPKLPAHDVPIEDWNLPQDLFYADPNFNLSSGIDMIIGNEHFFSCFKSAARIHLSDSLPLLVDSAFGWIVSGAVNTPKNRQEASACSITTMSLVSLEENDTPFQQILFRFHDADPVQTYRLLTVTYGMAPSSFLATRTLVQLADDEGDAYPLGGPAVKKGFYVDDFIGGAQSIPEAIQLRTELGDLMAKGGFCLRKWTSNKLEVLQGLEPDQIGTQSTIQFGKDETIKALGINWEPEADIFRVETALRPSHGPITKRTILSGISQLFDPWLLWLQPCGWDDAVSESIADKWNSYAKQLPKLSDFHVPRYALLPNATIQLHTFSDASEAAYGACTYARSVDSQGNVAVHLLASKSRVAPLKRISLPRLELCAADLATKLHTKISEALQIDVSASYFWSDSTVTLQWIRAPPNNWKTFVANRVSAIQSATHGAHWNHVAGKQNPADHVSRGMEIDEFIQCEEWKHGPKWLSLPEKQWPCEQVPEYPDDGKERRKVVVAVTRSEALVNPYFASFSSHSTMVRITAYCLRFVRYCREKRRTLPSCVPLPNNALSQEELAASQSILIKLTQADGFKEELKHLRSDNAVSKKSPIRRLSPILDPEGIIRVGGRLNLLEQPYITKHPVLLPNPHPYTRLLAKQYHLQLIHGGGRLTLAAMREKFWPIRGRRLIQGVIHACFRCNRASPVPATQQLGQLPIHRIRPSRPFSITGVDFAGPVYLRAIHKRAQPTKAYIFPEPDLTKVSLSMLDRLQATQRAYQQFWHHWRSEYLQELQLCNKINKPNDAFFPADS
nr:uncharacterized protein LOC115261307 [Aedes albopictus]